MGQDCTVVLRSIEFKGDLWSLFFLLVRSGLFGNLANEALVIPRVHLAVSACAPVFMHRGIFLMCSHQRGLALDARSLRPCR